MSLTPELEQRIRTRAEALKIAHQQALWRQTDRLCAGLLVLQWLAAIGVAAWLSPWSWEGLSHYVHPHVWAATLLGGLIALVPVMLTFVRPGETATRMAIAVAMMLHSALLIHLTGGRIETHFHVFGSLAILSFYRDWRVLIPATVVVAADHALRGIFLPESVFGVLAASPWRWVEHAWWVVFEDVFLVWACLRGAHELAMLATRQAQLEASHDRVGAEVARQTERLERVTQELVGTARRAGMAEVATGVLHNVGNVLNSVNVAASVSMQRLRASEVCSFLKAADLLRGNRQNLSTFLTNDERGRLLPEFFIDLADCLAAEQTALLEEMQGVTTGLEHIKEIVRAQQQHAKNGTLRERVSPAQLFEQAIAMDTGSAAGAIPPIHRQFADISAAALDKHRVLQILINLLSNARKAIANANGEDGKIDGGQITVSVQTVAESGGDRLRFIVTDSGVGISAENLPQIFRHGFTTRDDGHGFGLHSAANAAREMGGTLSAYSDGPGRGATFALDLPLASETAAEELMAQREGETCKAA